MLGWPPYCSELFSQADEVELVHLQDKVGFDKDSVTTNSGFKIAGSTDIYFPWPHKSVEGR